MLLSTPEIQQIFIQYLKQDHFQQMPNELYEPVRYIMSLGGKRLRPALLLMSCNLFSENIEKALPAAMAVEVFHNFSLVHDDIMDEAPLRRGKATVHHKYDINAGILSGDVMLIYAYEYLLQTKDKTLIPNLFKLFNQTAIAVCEGQQYDMNFETSIDVALADYLNMISLKTAALVAGGMKIGALIGGATEKDAAHIAEFGKNIGIAFQLQDDILDTYGDPEKFGKKVGGDIIQNKKTYLVLKTLEIADATTHSDLLTMMSTPTTNEAVKIKTVSNIFNQLNIREIAEKAKEDFQQQAFLNLNAVSVPEERKQHLLNLAKKMLGRES